ncbi:Trp family transcriptional regulator [Spirochaetia bacterium 38H-sp]|uniref:Trp family transcriptional regulator n=1 Tax=Rarispira pelagica TaxID=3141764 RepID=A0ABU9UCB9_9SPIR
MENNEKTRDYFKELVSYISTIDNPDKLMRFFEEILTPAERARLALRWELMVMLAYGFTQREIADRLGVSLCKVTRGAKILKDPESVTWELLEKMEEKQGEKDLT